MIASHRVVHPTVPNALTVREHGWQLIDAGRTTMPYLNAASPITAAGPGSIPMAEHWFRKRDAMPVEAPIEIVEVHTLDQLDHVMERAGPSGPVNEFGYAMSLKTLSIDGACKLWGFLGDELIAGAVALTTPPVAGIYAVFVNEEHRKKGYGAAITRAAVEAGVRRGAEAIWLGSTDMALSMYQKMGFQQVGEYQMLARPNVNGGQ